MQYKNSIRTRKTIKRVYSELICQKKDIKKITVKELVEKAGISKSTFYTHYQDIYAVAIDFEHEIISTLENLLNEYTKRNKVGIIEYLNKLVEIFKENEELYRNILRAEVPGQFIEQLKLMLKEAIFNDTSTKFLSNDTNVRQTQATFIANGFVYMLVDYFKGEMNLTLDELNQSILKILK